MASTVKALRARLAANVEAFYARAMSYERFSAAQEATWREIHRNKRVEAAVLALLRRDAFGRA